MGVNIGVPYFGKLPSSKSKNRLELLLKSESHKYTPPPPGHNGVYVTVRWRLARDPVDYKETCRAELLSITAIFRTRILINCHVLGIAI